MMEVIGDPTRGDPTRARWVPTLAHGSGRYGHIMSVSRYRTKAAISGPCPHGARCQFREGDDPGTRARPWERGEEEKMHGSTPPDRCRFRKIAYRRKCGRCSVQGAIAIQPLDQFSHGLPQLGNYCLFKPMVLSHPY